MLDPKNIVNLTGGLVTDPEIVNGKILKSRIAIDYSASEKDSDNNTGYFDVVYYLKDGSDFSSKNASFVNSQITAGKLKKGSQISVIGRLVQERWKQDDQSRSRIVIVIEHLSYAASSSKPSSNGSTASTGDASAASSAIPTSF